MVRVLFTLLVVATTLTATAEEVVIFKKESRYKGTAIRVQKVELDKHGRLLLTGARGELFSASPDDVDWETSRRMTEVEQAKTAERMARDHSEEKSRVAAARVSSTTQLTVLEASRQFGVDQPAISVPEGSAFHTPVATATADTTKGTAEAPSASTETPAIKKLNERIDDLAKQRETVAKDLDTLEKDTNPDPLSASLRTSRIQEKKSQLQTLDSKLSSLKNELEQAKVEAQRTAEQAKSTETKETP